MAPSRPLRSVRALPPNASWRPYHKRPWQRGYVTLFGHGKKWSGYLVDKYGDVIPASRATLSSALSSWRTGKHLLMDDRLLALVADVSDEFGGRPIRIVSGYREHSYAPDSRHKTGEAFDFSVPEVPNEALRDFLRSLHDVGVGYYPNSTHVHLDVRDRPTYWVDYSRPGDRPAYAWDRRVAGFTPQERALATALDALLARARASTAPTPPRGASETAPSAAEATLSPAPRATRGRAATAALGHTPRRPNAAAADTVMDAADGEREEGPEERTDAAPVAREAHPVALLPEAHPASSVSEDPGATGR